MERGWDGLDGERGGEGGGELSRCRSNSYLCLLDRGRWKVPPVALREPQSFLAGPSPVVAFGVAGRSRSSVERELGGSLPFFQFF